MRRMISLIVLVSVWLVGPAAADATDVTLAVADGDLGATLRLPEGDGPWPVVLILAGSGATDRDGNMFGIPGKNNSLLQLAEGLAAQGIASLRTDKRGVGGSRSAGLSESDLRFSHFVDDAVSWVTWLQADARFSAVTVAGHSQGSQVGMNAAWLAAADGFVSLAGPGRPIITVLREQLRTRLPVRTRVKAETVLTELEAGREVFEVPVELTMLLRPSVQAFLISWQRLDPVRDLARLSCPVAVVQGLTDIQVTETDARLLHGARPDADLLLLPGINHIFKPVEGENPIVHQASLTNPDLIFSPEAITAVAAVANRAVAYHQAWEAALDRAEAFNADGWAPDPETSEAPGSTGEAVAAGALRLSEAGADYRFGLAEGGYAATGRLVLDQHQDCVSFLYRSTESARGATRRDRVSWALRTRFAGAHPDSVVAPDGSVDYDRPEHLDYSLDMIRAGLWGRDVTAEVGGAVIDTLGTARYPAGDFAWLPADSLDPGALQPGDVIWFVLNPDEEKARQLRDEYGLVIGHIGVMAARDGQLELVHAASSGLPGLYEGGRVVSVDLAVYLARVERYAGIMVTRLE